MARPSQVDEKRRELIPVVARAFAELGYRRTSTAELAQRCGVQENILYRLWSDKKAMFIAAIDYVYELAAGIWEDVLAGPQKGSPAEKLLDYEAKHLGEYGYSRIVFAGLSEADDPDIRRALSGMYQRYQTFVRSQVGAHRSKLDRRTKRPDDDLTAWAFVGLGTVALIARELKLLNERERRRLLAEVGHELLG
jgi:AcrR family transcriptional regulator